MRPKKKILVINTDTQHCSEICYALWVNGYDVTSITHFPATVLKSYDLVLVFWNKVHDKSLQTVLQCRAIKETPVIVATKTYREAKELVDLVTARMYLPVPTTKELLEQVKNNSKRNRGPSPNREKKEMDSCLS